MNTNEQALRDKIGQALSDYMTSNADEDSFRIDPFDSNEVDALAEVVISALGAGAPASVSGASAASEVSTASIRARLMEAARREALTWADCVAIGQAIAALGSLAAAPVQQSSALESQPVAGKYAEVLQPFVSLMERELHANAGKGDRPGWMAMSFEQLMLEIYYHAAKLQKALRDDASYSIGEHAADVANLSMMVADGYGLLDLQRAIVASCAGATPPTDASQWSKPDREPSLDGYRG